MKKKKGDAPPQPRFLGNGLTFVLNQPMFASDLMPNVNVEPSGKIMLPDELRQRYGFREETRVRVVETLNGVLLIPLTDAPMSSELARELDEWQSLAAPAWDMFEGQPGMR
jgi:bifunctional DNA-binding transcriptional regulator/antitoxin component of YhaV-PrlF toxin-antitoxin module